MASLNKEISSCFGLEREDKEPLLVNKLGNYTKIYAQDCHWQLEIK